MASSSLTSRHFIPFSSVNPSRRRHLRRPFSISCDSGKSKPPDRQTPDRNPSKLLELSVTLTVFCSSLPLSPAIAAAAKTSGKKRKSSKTEAFSPEELKSWSRDLPTVADRIPYTEILNLKQEGKLKHIIKRPSSNVKQQPESVLVVLDDLKVLRTALPSTVRDEKFWNAWDQLNLNSVCINAYTPPVHMPATPSPYLGGFLSNLPKFLMSLVERKPKSKRALELERARKELVQRRKAMREEEERMERAMAAKSREEERKKERELRKAKYEKKLLQAQMNSEEMSGMWNRLARNQNVSTAIGIAFFYVFYRTVVLSYKKNQKDYEDRLKIEKAEAEEKRKIKQLEMELAGMEDSGDQDENKEGEKDPYREILKFMKSGARVRRADRKKLPQYLDKDVDVTFSDVAGLGKLQLELEEIVKFFTHGDTYRRRGVKIPG